MVQVVVDRSQAAELVFATVSSCHSWTFKPSKIVQLWFVESVNIFQEVS